MGYEYESHNISIAPGGDAYKQPFQLPTGKCIGMCFLPFGDIPAQNINLSIETTQGADIIKPVDVRDFLKGTIGGLESYKPTGFRTHGQVNVVVNTTKALASEFSGQLVLVIQKD